MMQTTICSCEIDQHPTMPWRKTEIIFCPLHSAAPELLEALESIVDIVDSTHGANEQVARARAAIAKARGAS